MPQTETPELVQALARQAFSARVNACTLYHTGGSADVYRVALDKAPYTACMKVFRSREAAGMAREEAEQVRILSAHSILPFPEIYFVHEPTQALPLEALGMQMMPGVCALNRAFYLKSPAKRRRMSDAAVESLLQIHKATNTMFGPLDDPSCSSWNAWYYPLAEEILTKTRAAVEQGRFRADTLAVMERAFARYADIFSEDVREAILIHGDYWPANLLVDPKSLEPQAVLDPFHSMWADREYELFALDNVMGSLYHLYDNYKSRWPVSRLCDLKCAFYALYSEVRWFHQLGDGSHPFMEVLAKRMARQMKRFDLA